MDKIINIKMTQHFDFFDQIKHRMKVDSQILIAYHIRKFIKQKKAILLAQQSAQKSSSQNKKRHNRRNR